MKEINEVNKEFKETLRILKKHNLLHTDFAAYVKMEIKYIER